MSLNDCSYAPLVNGFIAARSVALGRAVSSRNPLFRSLSIHGSVAGNAFATTLAILGAPPDILYRGGISGIVKTEKNGDFIPRRQKRTLTSGTLNGPAK